MEPPYDTLLKTQRETWDSVEVEGVRTVYYYGGGKGWVNDKEFSADADDLYYRMHWKFALTLKELGDLKDTLIFRTNSSSLAFKKNLVEYAQKLPKEGLYCGWGLEDSNYDGGMCISGSGIWLSYDCAEILKNTLNSELNCEEDVLIGRILRNSGIAPIDDKSRYDVPQIIPQDFPVNRYHYLCKGGGSRYLDAENMRKINNELVF